MQVIVGSLSYTGSCKGYLLVTSAVSEECLQMILQLKMKNPTATASLTMILTHKVHIKDANTLTHLLQS